MAALAGKDVSKLKAKGGGKWKYMSEKEMLEMSAKFSPYRCVYCGAKGQKALTDGVSLGVCSCGTCGESKMLTLPFSSDASRRAGSFFFFNLIPHKIKKCPKSGIFTRVNSLGLTAPLRRVVYAN